MAIRLKVVVKRHNLPDSPIVWAVENNPTISQVLEQINDVLPLESNQDWGLEDYAVELTDVNGKSFECLHFQEARQILKDGDEIVIRPLLTHDVKQRRISGRRQVSSDGRHLYDGIPFGRPNLRAAYDRPALDIPPRKRRRILYDLNEKSNNEIVAIMDSTDDENADEDFKDSGRQMVKHTDTEGSSAEDDDFEPDADDIAEMEDELAYLCEENKENANDGRLDGLEKQVDTNQEPIDPDAADLAIRAAFPTASATICRNILNQHDNDMEQTWDVLSVGFAPSVSRNRLSQIARKQNLQAVKDSTATITRVYGPESSKRRNDLQQPLNNTTTIEPSLPSSKGIRSEVDDAITDATILREDIEDMEEQSDSEDENDEEEKRRRYYDAHGLAIGSIASGKPLTTKPKIVFADRDEVNLKPSSGVSDHAQKGVLASGDKAVHFVGVEASPLLALDDLSSDDESDDIDFNTGSDDIASHTDDDSHSESTSDKSSVSSIRDQQVALLKSSSSSNSSSSSDTNDSEDTLSMNRQSPQKAAYTLGMISEKSPDDSSSNSSSSPGPSSDSISDSSLDSSSDSISDSSSDSDSDSAPEEYTSKAALSQRPSTTTPITAPTRTSISKLKTVAPGNGKKSTSARNLRRRNLKLLARLKEQKILPCDTSLAELRQLDMNKVKTMLDAEEALVAIRKNSSTMLQTSNRKEKKARSEAEAIEFAAKRQQLLDSLATGGIDVSVEITQTPQTARQDLEIDDAISRNVALQETPEPVYTTKIVPTNGSTVNDAVSILPPPTSADESERVCDIPPAGRRTKLDMGAGKRLLFGALGIRTPRNKSEEEKVKADLIKIARPLKIIEEPVALEQPPGENEDPEAWRQKIILRAVECCHDGVELREPPFPFVQRWDPQQKYSHKKARYRAKQNKQPGYTSKQTLQIAPGLRDDHNEETGYKETNSNFNADHAEDSYHEQDHFNYDDYKDYGDTEAQEQLFAENGNDQSHPFEDLPVLPEDLSALPDLDFEDVRTGAIIAFKQLEVSAATRWEPQVSGYRTAVVIIVNDSEIDVCLAQRDRKINKKRFNHITKERIYGRFDVPDEENDEFEDNGRTLVDFSELVTPKLLRKAPEICSAAPRASTDEPGHMQNDNTEKNAENAPRKEAEVIESVENHSPLADDTMIGYSEEAPITEILAAK